MPFCMSKCPYCDFYSVPRPKPEMLEAFTEALCREIEYYAANQAEGRPEQPSRQPEDRPKLPGQPESRENRAGSCPPGQPAQPIESIYFGGGTPCLLREAQFERIMRELREGFFIDEETEISMEANPAAVTEEKLAAFKEAGLNRLSIGAQSFDDRVLKILGRFHKREHIAETAAAARRAELDNISLDLMFGISGQSLESWRDSVRQAIELEPKHISLYSLEIMDNTRFARDFDKGIYHQTEEEEDRRMYREALEMLDAAGIMQYEISNAAIPGYECKHNMRYWNMGEYLGFGPSAHSFVQGVRYANIADVNAYIDSPTNAVQSRTVNTEHDNISEYIFTGLRRNKGISKADFHRRFGREIWDFYPKEHREFREFVSGGFAFEDEESIGLTRRGMDISNKIMMIFV